MKNKHYRNIIFIVSLFVAANLYSQCGSGTPSFTVNLTAASNATWVSPSVPRADTCCGWTGADKCIKFTVYLNPSSMGLNFGFASGAVPPGALFYSINCGPPIAVGTPICLNGPGPHILTFCKPGNNPNSFFISALPAPIVPDSILIRNGCTQTLSVSGFSVPTITWNSINPGPPGAYNSYLSCTAGCATITVTPTGTPPPFVDYVVSGFGQAPCVSQFYKDTVRVYFFSNLLATINPTLSTICFGSTSAILTATASGGLPPYTYSWTPIVSASTVVTVGPGTYTVNVFDKTGCPPTTATAVVNQYTLPISANAGPDLIVCKASPTVSLNGIVTNATGGSWSGGSGIFSPVSNSVITNYIPSATELLAGSVQLYLTTTGNSGCPPKQDTVVISFQNINMANAGPNATVCANNSIATFTGTLSGFSSAGQWSTSGNGIFGSITNLNTTYTPGSLDVSTGSVNIILTSTANGVCPAATSTLVLAISPSPTVNAGIGGSTCESNPFTLNATVIGATTTGSWSTSGSGIFSPSQTILNSSYGPSAADIAAGSVTLTLTSTNNGNCLAVSDTVIILIKQLATVNAGPNQVICSTSPTITLAGVLGGGGTSSIWTSSGTGPFNPNNTTLNSNYGITPADIISGLVTFTLTSTNNGPCPAVKDSVSMVIFKTATVNAGPDQLICSNAGIINLAGTVISSSNTAVWSSSGTGSFNPNTTSLNTTYSITPADILNGSISFTLSSTNNGVCTIIKDSVIIVIKQLATVNAGPNQILCSTSPTITLAGVLGGGGTSAIWTSSGTGPFNPNNTTLNGNYGITANDIALGSVVFTLTSTNNGPCPAVKDSVAMIIIKTATVNAGIGGSTCESNPFALNASIIGATSSGSWSTSGNGSFTPSQTVLNPNYIPSASDIAAGSVTLTLTSTNNGNCVAGSDTVIVLIKQLATVNAGPNQVLCSTSPTIILAGVLGGGGTSAIWTSSGTGPFNPNNTTLNSNYGITPNDIGLGSVIFTLTSTNNGPCPVVKDSVTMIIIKTATVNAGPDQLICSNAGVINLTGTVNSSSNTGVWSSSGTGSFNPNNTSFNTSYSITPADILNGFVSFTLASTNNGVCTIIKDSVKIIIKQLATVNAGPNQVLCSTSPTITLTGVLGGGGTSAIWTSSGTGPFNPNNTTLNSNYGITPNDIALGSVIFTLTSTNNGPCPVVKDSVTMIIIKTATVNAGPDQLICSNAGIINLAGTVSSSSNTGVWSSSGTGSFNPNNTTFNTSYSITPADIINGFVSFTLSSTNNGVCTVIKDSVKIVITKLAIVNVGTNKHICSSTSTIALTGTVTGGTSTGIWGSNGTGTFVPLNTFLNNTYFASASDLSSSILNFTLSSTNNGPCPVVTDTMFVFITPIAIVNAGPDQFICTTNPSVLLNGTLNSNFNSGSWSSSGSGIYIPSNTLVNTTYSITPNDASNGSVTFILASTNNGPCPIVRDTVLIKIKKLAVVNAGPDQSICSTLLNVPMNGTVSMGCTTGNWVCSGSGNFSPNNFNLNSTYNISASDINNGTVLFILTSTNNEACPAVSDTAVLTIVKKIIISLKNDTTICSYQNPIGISANTSSSNGQYIWSTSGTGAFATINNNNSVNYFMSAADINSGSVKLTITLVGTGACGSMNASINIAIHPTPTANFSASTYTANIPNDPIQFTNQSVGATSYNWNFGDGTIVNLPNPIHNYLTVGFYTVTLVSINQFGCRDTAENEIKVISDIQFPNVFTPNLNGSNGGSYNTADLSNDVFFPYTFGVVEYQLRIFNRWGELIFESQDVKIGWDGYFNGKLCQQDAYVWKAHVKFFDGRTYNKTGNVTLLR